MHCCPAAVEETKMLEYVGGVIGSITVIKLLVADFTPSVTVIVCDGAVFNWKPVNVWEPLSPDVNVYLFPEV